MSVLSADLCRGAGVSRKGEGFTFPTLCRLGPKPLASANAAETYLRQPLTKRLQKFAKQDLPWRDI